MIRHAVALVLTATLAAGLAGCRSETAPAPSPGASGTPDSWIVSGGPSAPGAPAPSGPGALAPPPPGSSGGVPSPVDEPPGLLTCTALAVAIRDASLMEPGVVKGIAAASGTADAPVADAAERLFQAYRGALLRAGTPSEPDAVAAVSAAAADMAQVCADSGFQPAS
jgi:hypothetical protein